MQKNILLVVEKFDYGPCLLMWVSYDMVITCISTVEYHIIRCIFSVFMFCNVKCCSCAQHVLDLFLLVQVFSCFLHWIKIYSTRNQTGFCVIFVSTQWTFVWAVYCSGTLEPITEYYSVSHQLVRLKRYNVTIIRISPIMKNLLKGSIPTYVLASSEGSQGVYKWKNGKERNNRTFAQGSTSPVQTMQCVTSLKDD